MAHVQYKRTVSWDVDLIDVGFLGGEGEELAISAVKLTAGSPTVVAGVYAPSAIVHNIASGILYVNAGTTAAPVFQVIEAGTISLTDANIFVGNATNQAVSVPLSGDATMANTGAITVVGTATERVGYFPTGSEQALSGAGAVDIVSYNTKYTSVATGDALTLADATRLGLIKKITYVAEAAAPDTGVLTPTTASGFTTITFNAVGDYAVLMWNGTAWIAIDYVGVTVA